MTDTPDTPKTPTAAPAPGLDSFDLYVQSVEAEPDLDPDVREILAAGVLVDSALRVAEKVVYARLGLSCRSGEGSRGDPAREAGRAAVLQVAGRILDVWTVRVAASRGPLPGEGEAEPEAAEAGERIPMTPVGFPPEEEP